MTTATAPLGGLRLLHRGSLARTDDPHDPPLDRAGDLLGHAGRRHGWWPLALLVGGVAFAARLVPVLRGGGLFGLGNYDDGVYFSAAVGLAHGLVPYRDFLLLHPPGILLLLWPFADLGRLVGDADAFAVARVAFMLLASLNAVLVARLLRPVGRAAAVVGGLCFALAYPAVFVGHTTLLETPTATLMLLALLILRPGVGPATAGAPWWSGVLLGASAGTKIWGVAVGAAVVVWALVALGPRRAVRVALGAVVGVGAVCLPFLAAAGPVMWRMVVLDQLARGGADSPTGVRLSDMVGLSAWQPDLQAWSTPTVVVAALVLGCAVLACRLPVGRLATVLLATTTVLLLRVPSWYIHYASLASTPVALLVGAATASVLGAARGRLRAMVVAAALLAVGVWSAPGLAVPFGWSFPADALRSAARSGGGCVTSDDPTTLVELGVLDTDLARRCTFVVDLSGYSYDLRTPGAPHVSRRENDAWQQQALTYLGSGTTTLVVRLSHAYGLTAASARTVLAWPVLAQSEGFAVQRPEP